MLGCNRHFPIKWNSSEDNGFMEMEEPCWREMESQKALILIGSFFFLFFFFFQLCLSFKLFKNFPILVPGSAVACSVSRESLPLFFLFYFKFLSLFFFPSPFSPRSHLLYPFYSDGGSHTHTVICHFNWACSVGNREFTAFCSGSQSNSPKSQTLAPSLCLWQRKTSGRGLGSGPVLQPSHLGPGSSRLYGE